MSNTKTTTAAVEGFAIGRSGQPSHGTSRAGTHGVDVKLDNVNGSTPNHPDGVVSMTFNSEAKAIAAAVAINTGNYAALGKARAAWYGLRNARNAVVVPVINPANVEGDYAALVAAWHAANDAYQASQQPAAKPAKAAAKPAAK